jgi:hypothetical protein
MINKEYVMYWGKYVSKSNNQKIILLKNSFLWNFFGSKHYGPLKQSKHIGLLIHDFNHVDQLLW